MINPVAGRLGTDLTGKVAVVTGAGSEFGLVLALYAAHRGMKVALADADPTLLTAAHETVMATNVETLAECTGRFDLAAVRRFSRRIEQELGPPWLVCNNDGWTLEANLWGVINGVEVFTPGMVRRGAGHVVNIAAEDLFGLCGAAMDIAVSQAIVGLSERLYGELDGMRSPVGVTVVCPTLIHTKITSGSPSVSPCAPSERGLCVVPPEELAERIFVAIERREFWVSSHAPQTSEAPYARADAA
jgi:NAD(P)-dependent dehydrogenase (short-subunit alcohol dehydrogenase family)